MKSPLRYPGGKSRAVNIILKYIPTNIDFMMSPFIGGGSVEIAVAELGIPVFGYDIFKPLVNFWEKLLGTPDELANIVEEYYPLSREKFYALQQHSCSSDIRDAAIFYVINRCSFSGSTLSGGMSPDHPRFTLSSIDRIRQFCASNLYVSCGDFVDTIPSYPNAFLYLDPPYLINKALYGRKGNAHKDFDHYKLLELLRSRHNWLLSYNNCTEICNMYAGYKIIAPEWQYGMGAEKNSNELLILSEDIE